MAELTAPRGDIRRRITDIYISTMLLIFPLFTGFSGYSSITFSKFAFFAAATGLWLAALCFVSIARRLPVPRPGKRLIPCAAFALALCVSSLLSPYGSEILMGAGRYDGLVTQLLYLVAFTGIVLFGELRPHHILCLGVSAGLCCLIGVLQLFDINVLRLFPGDYSYYDRGIRYSGAFLGTLGNTNVLSAFLCLAAPVLFIYPVIKGSQRSFISLIPLAPIIFVLIRANVSGGFVGLAFCALVAAPLLLTDMGRVRRALASAAACAVFAAVALTYSPVYENRAFSFSFSPDALTALCLATAVAMAAAALVLSRSKASPCAKTLRRFFILLDIAAVLGALLFIYFSPASEGTLYELSQVLHGNIDERFGSSRVLIWRECLAVWKDFPIFGSGPDTLALRVDVEFSRYVEETGNTLRSSVDNAHNEYLGYLINLGLFGLLSYMSVLVTGAALWLRRLREPLAAVLGLGLVCYCAQSFFALGLCLVAPVFWVALALIFAHGGNHD